MLFLVQIALCLAFEMILKYCPPLIWGIDKFLRLLFVPEICLHISKCLDYVINTLDLIKLDSKIIESVCTGVKGDKTEIIVATDQQAIEKFELVDRKRRSVCSSDITVKRQKLEATATCGSGEIIFEELCSQDVYRPLMCSNKPEIGLDFSSISEIEEQKRYCAALLHQQMLYIIDTLKPDDCGSSKYNLDGTLSAFKVLAGVFSCHPCSIYYGGLIKLLEFWIPWMNGKV